MLVQDGGPYVAGPARQRVKIASAQSLMRGNESHRSGDAVSANHHLVRHVLETELKSRQAPFGSFFMVLQALAEGRIQ
jgi:hypothetical protein